MSRRRTKVGLAVCLILLLGAGIYYCFIYNPYRDFASQQLAGEISYIVYEPNCSGDKAKVTDRQMIEQVRSWLLSAGIRGFKPGAACSLTIFMKDGRRVQLHIGITEWERGGPRYSTENSEDSVTNIYWGGYERGNDNQPFSDILTRTGERARLASRPEPSNTGIRQQR